MPKTLVDSHGRVHRDLRISLIDKCNLRCTYCLPAEGIEWLPKPTLLTRAEIVRVARVAVSLGVTEIRLTGGEPLLRPDLVAIVSDLAQISTPTGPVDLSMTTNGIGLERVAGSLVEAGLRRINVSLDTLNQKRFHEMTRRDRLPEVLAGIDAAAEAGLNPIKINAVLMHGANFDEAVPLAQWAMSRGFELRFIEQMPLDAGHIWSRSGMVTADEIHAALSEQMTLKALPGRGAAPAERFEVDGGPATLGIIASVTRPFCGACDRIRLTADGNVRACLFSRTETDLASIMRTGGSDVQLQEAMAACIGAKLPGHGIDAPEFLQPDRPMSAIGG